MTDINQSDDSNTFPPQTTRRAVRWRIIPGTFLAIFAVIGSIGMLFETLNVIYYNMKYGWIQVDPRNPALSRMAITPLNILVWQFACWGYLVAGVSTSAWFYGQWRLARIGTFIFFALMFAAKWLESV